MRGQGQRLRPTAERKGRGEIQPNRAGGGYDLTDSALRQWESSELLQLRGCDQSRARINPRTIQGRLVGSNTRICCLVKTKRRSGLFFSPTPNYTAKEWSDEFTRAIGHNNPHSDRLSIIYVSASISLTNHALKSRNKHACPVILQDSAPKRSPRRSSVKTQCTTVFLLHYRIHAGFSTLPPLQHLAAL